MGRGSRADGLLDPGAVESGVVACNGLRAESRLNAAEDLPANGGVAGEDDALRRRPAFGLSGRRFSSA